MHELRENDLRFSGNTYLLNGHFTFSSVADFAWTFKHFEMGEIIGEETGGLAISFGDIIVQNLPNSDLQLNVLHKLFFAIFMH